MSHMKLSNNNFDSNSDSETNSQTKLNKSDTKTDSNTDSNTDSETNTDSELEFQTNKDILSQIDRKLLVKFMKEGRNSKTYVIGLDYYMKPDTHLNFCKDLQKKKLSTGMIKRMDDNKTTYVFAGDHRDKIIEELIKTKLVPKNEIKKQ